MSQILTPSARRQLLRILAERLVADALRKPLPIALPPSKVQNPKSCES